MVNSHRVRTLWNPHDMMKMMMMMMMATTVSTNRNITITPNQ